MHKENLVQGAISAALEVYCDRNHIHADVCAPYANQQGYRATQYCADLLALLDHARLLVLEVKELEPPTHSAPEHLPRYDAYQHYLAWRLEELNVPIFYAYGATTELSYFGSPRAKQWPYSTLQRTSLSKPSALFISELQRSQKRPNRQNHDDLLSWILTPPSSAGHLLDNLVALSALTVSELRNSELLVLCNHGSTIVPNLSTEAIELLSSIEPDKDLDPTHPRFDEVRSAIQAARNRAADTVQLLKRDIDRLDELIVDFAKAEYPKRGNPVPTGQALKRVISHARPMFAEQKVKGLIGNKSRSERSRPIKDNDRSPQEPDPSDRDLGGP